MSEELQQTASPEAEVTHGERQRHDNSGAFFRNDKKNKPEHPDFTGSALIGGREYWVSAWKKTSRNEETFVALSFRPKDAATPAAEI